MRALAALLVALAGSPALAQHHDAQAPDSGSSTRDLQGDPAAFLSSPHVRAFYDLSVATLGPSAPKQPDIAAYEQKSYALFRALGESRGMSGAAMQDHLKLIPRQVVQIVEDDPHVLDSYDAFMEALVGPK
jgi:hypothetical protein